MRDQRFSAPEEVLEIPQLEWQKCFTRMQKCLDINAEYSEQQKNFFSNI